VPGDPHEARCPRDGQWYVDRASHESYPNDPLLGADIEGKYPLVEVLGEGGFGVVYRALQLSDGRALREVAVKIVRTGGARSTEESVGRFRREAEAIARLNHPNIVQLYDSGVTQGGTFYMVLELVRGRTLSQVFFAEEPFAPDRVLRLFRQLLQALAAAHEAGMVHRDLKPDNVMLVETAWEPECVKVLDFGLAKVFGATDGAQLSQANVAYGTVQYMAPEQIIGSAVDCRTDLYPIGVMLYRMYAGMLPFDGESPAVVMFQHIHDDVPELPPESPAGMCSFIYRALQKRPKLRFSDAMTMLRDLEQALAEPGFLVAGGERPRGLPRASTTDGAAEDVPAGGRPSGSARVSRPLVVGGQAPASAAQPVSAGHLPASAAEQVSAARAIPSAAQPISPVRGLPSAAQPVSAVQAPVPAVPPPSGLQPVSGSMSWSAPAAMDPRAAAPTPRRRTHPWSQWSRLLLLATVAGVLLILLGVVAWFVVERRQPGRAAGGAATSAPVERPVRRPVTWSVESFDEGVDPEAEAPPAVEEPRKKASKRSRKRRKRGGRKARKPERVETEEAGAGLDVPRL